MKSLVLAAHLQLLQLREQEKTAQGDSMDGKISSLLGKQHPYIPASLEARPTLLGLPSLCWQIPTLLEGVAFPFRE